MSPKAAFCAVILFQSAVAQSLDTARISNEVRGASDAGEWDRARKIVEDAIRKAAAARDRVAEARLIAERARYEVDRDTYFHKDPATVARAIEATRAASKDLGDKIASALTALAEGRQFYWKAIMEKGSWDPPTRLFDESVRLYEEAGDSRGLGEALFYRGLVEQMQDRPGAARQRFDRALALSEGTHDDRTRSYVVRHIAYLQQAAKQSEVARANFELSLALRRKNGMKIFVPFALLALADFEAEQGNHPRATELIEQALVEAKRGNSARALFTAQLSLAKERAAVSRVNDARKLAQESREGALSFGDPGAARQAEEYLGSLRSPK